MEESILTTIKKLLGVAESDTAFDEDIVVHINSALMTLQQIGVGPDEVFTITGNSETWSSLFTDPAMYQATKTFILLSVKLVFDNNVTGHVLAAMERQREELLWRLTNQVPIPPVVP